MNQKIIVRMPPSPTGALHLGTARTALFNWCFAKANDGEIVFRWEDTDKERSKTEFETQILEGLTWLGMDFGKGANKFTRQTDNTEKHNFTLAKLWQDEKIFPCFTTPEELDKMRNQAHKEKRGFVFWSPYREWSTEKLQAKMDSGTKFVWRLRTPRNEVIEFDDLVKGKIAVNTETLGDFVIARSDGSVLYLLANVVDDLSDNISHVIRGDDHISNTPKQICLLNALNEKPFIYAHIPLVLDAQKKKLSKRNVQEGVCILIPDFQAKGFVPEAVVNGLAFLGWNPKTTEEIFSLQDLEKIFDLKKVNPAAAQYDFGKMEWFNQQWIKQMDIEKLKGYFLKWTDQYGRRKGDEYLENETRFTKAMELVRQKATTLEVLATEIEYLCFSIDGIEEGVAVHNEKMNITPELAQQVLDEIKTMLKAIDESDFTAENIKAKSIEKITEMGLKNGQFLWPFRVALSGRAKSIGPFDMAEVLGKDEVLVRISG